MSSHFEVHDKIGQLYDNWAEQWESFSNDSQLLVCRWFVDKEAYLWVEGYFEREASEAGATNDLFIRFNTPFINADQYERALARDFQHMLNEYTAEQQASKKDKNADEDGSIKDETGFTKQYIEEEMDSANIRIKRRNISIRKGKPSSSWMSNLSEFAEQVPDFEGNIIAYLSPEKNESINQWVSWIVEKLQYPFPARVKWMIVDTYDFPLFDFLLGQFPKRVFTIKPNLDVDQLMQDLASVGNPSDPGVQFRQAFVALTQAAGKADQDKVEKHGNEALTIAKREGWIHLEVTIHMTQAGALIGMRSYQLALQKYQVAEKLAIAGYSDGKEECSRLIVQAQYGMGNCYIAFQQYEDALSIYEKASFQAEEIKDTFLQMEAERMMAYCLEADGNHPAAYQCFYTSLETGKQLDEATRINSTFPYIGQQLIRLAQKLGKGAEIVSIREMMLEYAGPDWENKAMQS